nr:DUF4149 domain-containing protein [Xanthomonadales bacterium]NIX14258.1 DUF4149 domain-containing protein [Xanthomonadales bacterium]
VHFIYLASLVCWLGSIVFFSFIAAPVIFKSLDRGPAGEVVGGIFPKYYGVGYVCSVFVLATLLSQVPEVSMLKTGVLLFMMICNFVAGLGVHPRARQVKEQMRKTILPEDRAPLEERFRKLHAVSVQLNGAVLVAGLGLLWLTGSGLQL